jgi:hypothetical protein
MRVRPSHHSAGGLGFLLALPKLSPPSKKISEFSTRRSAIAVAMVVLKRMLPQSEKGVLVVMMVERFLTVAGRDHLIKKVGGLLIEGQIAQLIDDEQNGLGIGFQLADQRVIDLGSEQVSQVSPASA